MARDDGRRDKTFSFMEGIIAIGALVTSSTAVYIAYDQAGVMHSEQRATVLPALQIDSFEAEDNANIYFGFNVENAGVGPAFLYSATLSKKEGLLEGEEHLRNEMPPALKFSTATEPMSGRVIAPGVSKQALKLTWEVDPAEHAEELRKINVATGDLALEICYCDTLKNCWTAKSGARVHPKPISGACPAPKKGGLF
jgi:hypothetical protein